MVSGATIRLLHLLFGEENVSFNYPNQKDQNSSQYPCSPKENEVEREDLEKRTNRIIFPKRQLVRQSRPRGRIKESCECCGD